MVVYRHRHDNHYVEQGIMPACWREPLAGRADGVKVA
jgi:hypothetical protein